MGRAAYREMLCFYALINAGRSVSSGGDAQARNRDLLVDSCRRMSGSGNRQMRNSNLLVYAGRGMNRDRNGEMRNDDGLGSRSRRSSQRIGTTEG